LTLERKTILEIYEFWGGQVSHLSAHAKSLHLTENEAIGHRRNKICHVGRSALFAALLAKFEQWWPED
jgi:hypothetical protein